MTKGPPAESAWPRTVFAAAAVALVAFLPFVRGVWAGHSLFFRDLSLQFFPLRRFVVEGLRLGELRYWNPYTHEGEPLSLLPLGYPPDLLQVALPSEAAFSLLLALHVPLAALGLFALSRHLGASRLGAVAGGLVYALGGFGLSTVNLYVYVQALAWAPFVVLALSRAGAGRRKDLALAALAVAVALTTTGVEIVAQTLVIGLVLAAPRRLRGALGLGVALLLGAALAAPVLLPLASMVGDSARGGGGFATEVTLAHSVHPITLLQTVVGNLYGDLSSLSERWWGQNFFPRGSPYILSLYLGATVLALAATGLWARPRPGIALATLGAIAVVVSVGRFAGLEPLVEGLPWLRRFRFPVKAFFTVHFAVSLLCALGLSELASSWPSRNARRFALFALGIGSSLVLGAWLASQYGPLHLYLLSGFFPPGLSWAAREASARVVILDAAVGGGVAVAAGSVALLALRRQLGALSAVLLILALVAADLLRTGAGLNPMVSPSFFECSPAATALAREVKAGGGRLFVLDANYSSRYFAARAERGDSHEAWTFAVMQEMFTPDFNLALGVPTAFSLDRTMLVPEGRVLPATDAGSDAFPRIVDRLRVAAVSHVLSLDPVEHPDLEARGVNRSERIAPLGIYVYRLRGTRPRCEIEGRGRIVSLDERPERFAVVVEADEPATIVIRNAWAPGWRASVDGKPVALSIHERRHLEVRITAGRHELRLDYNPPGLVSGMVLAAAAALATTGLAWSGRREGVS